MIVETLLILGFNIDSFDSKEKRYYVITPNTLLLISILITFSKSLKSDLIKYYPFTNIKLFLSICAEHRLTVQKIFSKTQLEIGFGFQSRKSVRNSNNIKILKLVLQFWLSSAD